MNSATREAYGKALAELGKTNPNVVALDADLAGSTKSAMFGNKFPERFFDMGIAEADMVGTAAGLATCGKIPFASSFAVFCTGRAFEQIRNSVCNPGLNVKMPFPPPVCSIKLISTPSKKPRRISSTLPP